MPTFSIAASKTFPAGPTKGLPGKILLVAGLLADEHDVGVAGPFAEDRLGRHLVERAAAAALNLGAGVGERGDLGGLGFVERHRARPSCRCREGGWLA